MALFLTFLPTKPSEARPVVPGPMEFFTSIEVARWELIQRGRTQKGTRALAADTETHGYRDRQRVAAPVAFHWAHEGRDGWRALVWWRRAGQPAPAPHEQAGELWVSIGRGKVERRRLNDAEWNTGRANNGENARPAASAA